MRNFFGNRWGKIGLILFICFAVHGFVMSNSYAEQCCLCGNGAYVAKGASTCDAVCQSLGGYASVYYTLHTGMTCNAPCSDDAGYCFKLNQSLCDRDTNKEELCSADTTANSRKCGVYVFGNAVFPETGWTPCNAGESCFYSPVSDSWDNTNRRTTTDEDDQCATQLYGN